MKTITKRILAQLAQTEWFSAVGQPVEGPFIGVRSWAEAVASCASLEWENLLMEASNRHFSLTAAKAPERSRQWNEIIEKLKSATVPLVRRQIAKAAFENKLPQVFEDTVQWDILGVCVEAEYSDVQSPGFYASQAYWYINGHFPCGWRGPFPEGQIILY